ncbi:MAG TPA: hypothetical protein VFM05_01390 [Candidatus Saccharimonadales bacterium]|nr:hypothetical protein [Candidatus Saccharimonadales bacterium]
MFTKFTLAKVLCSGLLILFTGGLLCPAAKPTVALTSTSTSSQNSSDPAMLPSYTLRKARVDSASLQAAAASTTSLAGLFRFTCEADSGFLPEQCRADLFGSCSADGPRVSLTTDNYVSLRINIDNAQEGDKWTWTWRSPNNTASLPSTLQFHEEFNGEQLCFEFFTPFGIHGFVCGGRSISFEWGSGIVHGGAEGLWFVDLNFKEQLLFHEPFELVQPPQVEFNSFSARDLAFGTLGVNLDLIVSPRDPGARTVNLKVLTSSNPVAGGSHDYTLQPGINELAVNLAQLGIGPFDDDVTLQIQTATPCACASIPRQQNSAALEIPLPVIFIHGYVEGSLRFALFSGSTSTIIRQVQADGLFDYLIGLTASQPNPTTGVFRIPYERAGGTYPTLFRFDWLNISDSPVETITQELKNQIAKTLIRAYATRVNLLAHSLGGLVSRLAIADGATVRKLIMVGTPNNGTSYVWVKSSTHTLETVSQLATTGIIGYALPRIDDLPFRTRGPYQKGDPCSVQSLPILRRTMPPLPTDTNVKIFNIFTNNVGTDDTPWDLIATFDKRQNWYKFVQRQLQVAQSCDATTSWASYRKGDGVVSVEDATLGPDYDIQIETEEKLKGSGLPHLLQLGNNLVRQKIARALGVIE